MQNRIYEQDFSLKELPQPVRELLQTTNLPWLNSLEFCTSFDILNPAERVLLKINKEKIHCAVFYRLKNKIGLLRIVEIIGFPDVTDEDIKGLIKKHHAHLAVLNRLEKPVEPEEKWRSPYPNIYCKTYVTVVKLPPTKDEYLSQLGKNKRKQLPQYQRRLNRHFENTIEVRYQSKKDIKLEEVLQLEFLNRDRRVTKGKGVDSLLEIEQRQKNLLPLTEASGLMVTLRHGGKIIGGTLNFIHGNDAYMLITGHDATNDNLRIGLLGIWKTMDYLIAHGITQCNFLWGRKVYKTQFLGVEYPWSISVISSYQWLAVIWKIQISFNEFYNRAWRALKTRMGLIG